MEQEAPKLIMSSINCIQWYHVSLKCQKSLSHTDISSIDERVWSKTFMGFLAQLWSNMAKSLTSSGQSKVPMRESTKQSVRLIPGYIQLLKNHDNSKYDNSKVQ